MLRSRVTRLNTIARYFERLVLGRRKILQIMKLTTSFNLIPSFRKLMFERCSIMNRTYIADKKSMQRSYLMIDSQAILPDSCFLISFGRAMANSWRPKDQSSFTSNISLSIDKRWRVDQTCTNTRLVHSSQLFQKV